MTLGAHGLPGNKAFASLNKTRQLARRIGPPPRPKPDFEPSLNSAEPGPLTPSPGNPGDRGERLASRRAWRGLFLLRASRGDNTYCQTHRTFAFLGLQPAERQTL